MPKEERDASRRRANDGAATDGNLAASRPSPTVAGHYTSLPDLIRTLAELTGRRIRFATFPAWFLAAFGRTADVVQRGVRTRLPWDGEGIWVMNCAARCDDSKTRSELQLEPRPLRETLADTVRWLVEVGHLSAREAGHLA